METSIANYLFAFVPPNQIKAAFKGQEKWICGEGQTRLTGGITGM